MKAINLSGQEFGRLTVERPDGRAKSGEIRWRCRCRCGTVVTVASSDLRRPKGGTISCGCHRAERAQADAKAGALVRAKRARKQAEARAQAERQAARGQVFLEFEGRRQHVMAWARELAAELNRGVGTMVHHLRYWGRSPAEIRALVRGKDER